MRWEKGDKYIEIIDGVSVERGEAVAIVETNLGHAKPDAWLRQVPHSDIRAHNELIESVTAWAEKEGFRRGSAPATFDCFAYGSNILWERLTHKTRCPSATVVGVAHVPSFRLAFSKRSEDGSGKATLVPTTGKNEAPAHGVIFRIPIAQRDPLDIAEGLGSGYERDDRFKVILSATGAEMITTAYIAPPSARDDSRIPYEWYRDLALAGAVQNKLPSDYIAMLRKVRASPDPKPDRPARIEALKVLKQAGFGDGVSA